MAPHPVEFRYFVGLKRALFRNPRLAGSWDSNGRHSDVWTRRAMQPVVGSDGCPAFTASLLFDTADVGKTFKWGVMLDGPQGANFWGIPTEVQDVDSAERYRTFRLDKLSPAPQIESYYFTSVRRLGANKHWPTPTATPSLRFAIWAPNATEIDVVFGDPARGYIDDTGAGIDPAQPMVALSRSADGIWEGGPPGNFATYLSLPYMYRIRNAQGRVVYRTDIYSRSQIGKGDIDPASGSWPGTPETLDGTVSCSIVIDPDVVRAVSPPACRRPSRTAYPPRNSGPENSRPAGRCRRASKTWSSTSCMWAHWASARRGRAIWATPSSSWIISSSSA